MRAAAKKAMANAKYGTVGNGDGWGSRVVIATPLLYSFLSSGLLGTQTICRSFALVSALSVDNRSSEIGLGFVRRSWTSKGILTHWTANHPRVLRARSYCVRVKERDEIPVDQAVRPNTYESQCSHEAGHKMAWLVRFSMSGD